MYVCMYQGIWLKHVCVKQLVSRFKFDLFVSIYLLQSCLALNLLLLCALAGCAMLPQSVDCIWRCSTRCSRFPWMGFAFDGESTSDHLEGQSAEQSVHMHGDFATSQLGNSASGSESTFRTAQKSTQIRILLGRQGTWLWRENLRIT